MYKIYFVLIFIALSLKISAQKKVLNGYIVSQNTGVEFAVVTDIIKNKHTSTDSAGFFKFIIDNNTSQIKLGITCIGFKTIDTLISVIDSILILDVSQYQLQLDEVVISGTMKEVSKLESPVPIEVYNSCFFKANPTPSLFDGLQNINGVRPQLNCNICNTGDIHINGLEGPYTMVLIDGMPLVSGLSTVYGLSGIPQSLIDRVEVVKGPASTLYGSEAVGGLINVITKKPSSAPLISADVFGTSWGEINADVAGKFKVGKKTNALLGVNGFVYDTPIDNNNDGFTDVTLQKRLSMFNKWNVGQFLNFAGRYVYEERWGGDMRWNNSFRGGDSIYAEAINTKRWELFGTYKLPISENVSFQFSANGHHQNSVYGTTKYIALQNIGFGQLLWNKQIGAKNDLLLGATLRYTYYDDNTPATADFDTINTPINKPSVIYLPGIFLQNEITINENNKLLIGLRYDYNSLHGNIFTPRMNYKLSSRNKKNILRLSIGNGYRVANVFTEDHAALTGARNVVFLSDLKPETSYNANVNFVKKVVIKNKHFLGLDATAFYTYFTNKIFADYNTDANKIIYDNLKGFAVSQGISLNLDLALSNGLKFLLGGTLMDVSQTNNGIKSRQTLTERYTMVWNVSYEIKKMGLDINYTGNLYGPMILPLLGDLDPRPANSPAWSIQNIQLTKKVKKRVEVYGGVKNFLNWTPAKNSPFLIARSNDPFDKQVSFDNNGNPLSTPNNPYALTFDPNYVYAPNQGIRFFLGVRFQLI